MENITGDVGGQCDRSTNLSDRSTNLSDRSTNLSDRSTNLSAQTPKEQQHGCAENKDCHENPFTFKFTDLSLEDIRKMNENFIRERNWDQFHSPRNVLLALVGEVGELSEIFQWKGEVSEGLPELTEDERKHVGEEISDIMLYLVDFACRCHIDLPQAVISKIAANAKKYPVDKSYGQANKYTDYQ